MYIFVKAPFELGNDLGEHLSVTATKGKNDILKLSAVVFNLFPGKNVFLF